MTPFRASLTGVLEVLQTDAAWAVSKVGECLGVVSRLVSLDLDQRWPQETVAMPRVNAVKKVNEKRERVTSLEKSLSSLGPRERHWPTGAGRKVRNGALEQAGDSSSS